MKKLEQLLFLVNKISKGLLFKKYSVLNSDQLIQVTDSTTWKVDWIDQNGEKGTYDTQVTDLKEAEWKFNYMFDDSLKIIKMHRHPSARK